MPKRNNPVAGSYHLFSMPAISMALGLCLFSSTVVAVELVGIPTGKLSVDPSGAANYNIPIQTPPGVAGVSPGLSLLYNSRAGNGLLGMGWSLSGLSAISRCSSTIATDGVHDGVDLDSNDKYCLDGQRLIHNGGNVYGTEVESFQRVVRETGNGTCSSSFRVQDKSGLVREYAGTTDSCIEAGTTGEVLTWAVSRISDIFGNYISFSYEQDTVNGEYWPERIEYGSAVAAVASVEFSYDTTRPDVSYGYVAGAKRSVGHRLNTVTTFSQGAPVRSYNLEYRQGGKSGRSQLDTVRECDASGDCLPAIKFHWQQGALGFATASPGSLNTGLFHPQVLDMDGDGILDLAYFSNSGGGSMRIYRGASSYSSSFRSGINLTQAQAEQLKVLDYNGDGRSDLAYPANPVANSTWVILRSRGLDPIGIDPPTCPGGEPPGTCPVDTYFDELNTAVPYNAGGKSFFLDVDTDGRDDLLHSGLNSVELYLNSATGIVTAPTDTASYPGLGFQRSLTMDEVAVNLDGDGRSDALLYYCVEQIDRACNSSDPHYFVKVSYGPNNNLTVSDIDGILGNQITTKVRPVDVNGDGLTDIMYRDNSSWRVHIHNGQRFLPAVSFNPGITIAQADRVQVIDYNGDGRTDLIYPKSLGSEVWHVATSNGSGWSEVISTSVVAANATLFVDLSGDGLTDLFFDANGGSQQWELRRQQPMMHDLLARIYKEHLDDETNVFYVPATDRNFYTRGDYVASYPTHSFAGPLFLVSHFSADTGTLTDTGEPGRVFTSYHYAEGVVDREGRGFRGFRELRALNSNTQTLTINTHKLEFPFNGMLEVAEQQLVDGVTLDLSRADVPLSPSELVGPIFDICNEPDLGWTPPQCNEPQPDWPLPFKAPYVPSPDLHNGMLVSRTTNTLAQTTSLATGEVFPHIAQGEQELFDLASGDRYKQVQTNFTYDGWGNATDVVVNTYNGTGGELHVLATHNDYVNWTSGDQWCLARLMRSEVRQQRHTGYAPTGGPDGNPAVVDTNADPRVSTYDYDSTTCQLIEATTDPASSLELKRNHSYDQFGNKIATTISGADIEPRVTRTIYDSWGQFPISVQNDLGHIETREWDRRFGLQLTQTGPNGLMTQWDYDGLGRRIQEIAPLATLHREWTLEWCDVSPGGCVSPFAKYKVSQRGADVSAAGGIHSITEFDKLGREVGTRNLMLGGNYATTEMRYDPLGRMFAKSLPSFAAPACWLYSSFDNLGRIVQERRPASSGECGGALPTWNAAAPFAGYSRITDYSYNGLMKTVTYPAIGTPAVRRQETRVQSPADRLLTVCEGANCNGAVIKTQYDYDVYGNTTWVKDAGGNISKMYYNKLGHKIEMRDPDMGTWLYQYNVLGELVSQTDAKGQTLEQRYDTLGRMTYRSEPEGETQWIYDIAPGKGVGMLAYVSAPDGYGEGYAYDDYGRVSETIRIVDGEGFLVSQTYDEFGRMDVLSYPDRDAGVVLPNAPGQPGVVQVPGGVNTSGNYTVSWSAASGTVVNYKLFESAPDGTFPAALRLPEYISNTTSFAVTDRNSGTYKYKVQACNTGGCGTVSTVSAALIVDRPLGQAHAPHVQTDSSGTHTVRWDAYPGAAHYKLYRSTNQTFTGAPVYSGTELSYTDVLTINGTFYYAVRACETSSIATCGVLSVASNAAAVSLPVPNPPAAPAISPDPSTGAHTVSWPVVSGALTYQLYRSTSSGSFPGGPIAQTTALSAPDSAGVGQYYYVLEACAGSNYSACSAKGPQTAVQVQPVAPNAPTFTNVVDASVTVNWNSVSGAGRYVLDRRLGSNTINVYDNAATSYADEVSQTGTYDYKVKACGGSGNSICGQYSPFSSVFLDPAVQGPPDPPLNVDGPNFVFTNTNYTIDWDPPQGTVDEYDVQEKRNSGAWSTVATRVPTFYSTSHSAQGEYDYRVRACINGPPRLCSAYAEMPGTVFVETRNRSAQDSAQTGDNVLDRNSLLAGVRFVRASYAAQRGSAASASAFAIKHTYSDTGHLIKVQRVDDTGALGQVYWEGQAVDALGNMTQERLAGTDALGTTRTYDEANGYLEFLASGNAAQIQNHEYDWDAVGNLVSRRDLLSGHREDFSYDGLYRLDTVTFTPNMGPVSTTAHSYNDVGNLLSKGDISNYQYGVNAGPHAVTSVSVPAGSRNYSYDDNGNLLTMSENSQQRRNITWTSFNKPVSIANPFSGAHSTFSYDTGRSRYKQVAQVDGREETTVYIAGFYERKTIDNDYVEHRHYVNANGRVVAEYTVSDDIAIDSDGDGVLDTQDNCTARANPDQRDTDGDSYGNVCDGDFNNDGVINFLDLGYMKDVFFSNDPDGDMDGSGAVNFIDLALLQEGFFGPPGPSGVVGSDGQPRGERTQYWLRDHLGSVAVIADGAGNVLESLSYDAWGKRRPNLTWENPGLSSFLTALNSQRGYTGHEHLDHLGLINMNGRIYDPEIGRFLSADVFVQFPDSTQGLNRYSYVGNNPLSYSDPSGHFIFAIIAGLAFEGATLGVVVAAVGVGGFIDGYLASGGDLGAALQGGIISALSAGIANGIGGIDAFESISFATNPGLFLAKATLHGLSQGALSELGGGRFGDGFLGGFSASALEPITTNVRDTAGSGAAVVTAAVVGGTVSSVAGGKFANGAASAAFVEMFNNGAHGSKEPTVEEDETSVAVRAAIKGIYEASYDSESGYKDAIKLGKKFKLKIERDGSATLTTGTAVTKFDASQIMEGAGLKMGHLTVSATVSNINSIQFSGTISLPKQLRFLGIEFSVKVNRTINVRSAFVNNSGLLGEAARGLTRRRERIDQMVECSENGTCGQ